MLDETRDCPRLWRGRDELEEHKNAASSCLRSILAWKPRLRLRYLTLYLVNNPAAVFDLPNPNTTQHQDICACPRDSPSTQAHGAAVVSEHPKTQRQPQHRTRRLLDLASHNTAPSNVVHNTHPRTAVLALPTPALSLSPLTPDDPPAPVLAQLAPRQRPALPQRRFFQCARRAAGRVRRAERRHGRPGAELCAAAADAREPRALQRELCWVPVRHEYECFLRRLS